MKYPRRRFLLQSQSMSYQEFWDRQSETVEAAIQAVDGSSDETTVRLTGKWTANQVSHALELQAGDRVLELGCGVGRIGRELAAKCGQWVGSDISPNMLKAAAHRLAELDNVGFAQLDRSSFQGVFADDSFDKAYSVAVFCHMDKEDLYLYLRDLHRIVRPGGLIYIETWNLAHPVGWRRWEHEVRNWSRLAAGERKDAGRNQFCHPAELALYVEQAGFEPLARYDNSPWVQIIAGKSLDRGRKEHLLSVFDENAQSIAYSGIFSECFEKTMDLHNGEIETREMLNYLDSIAGTPEGELFRPYIEASWGAGTES
jgi:SAM-dependent methyltransferase